MEDKKGVLICGSDFQALGALRTLAKKGIPVAVAEDEFGIARFSKYLKKAYEVPSLTQHDAYVEALVNIAKQNSVNEWLLLPNSDEAVCIISKNKEILREYYTVQTPDWDVIKNVYIKQNTYQLAEKHGIPIPTTYVPENIDDLLTWNLQYPLVIKPSIRDNFYNQIKVKAFRVNNREELIKTYQYVASYIDASEILVQQMIQGGPENLYSYCPFFKDGKSVTGITARRSRQHPMDFGHASTFAEVVQIPILKLRAEKFLRLINYYGIAEVEFMYDSIDDDYKLIEVNPRIWGWHNLAIGAGADLPYYLYQDVFKNPYETDPPLEQLKWMHLTTDVATVMVELLKGRMTLKHYFSTLKGKKVFGVWDLKDPMPFFAELILLPYLAIKRGF